MVEWDEGLGGSVVLVGLQLAVGGFFKFRFLQAGTLSEPEPEGSAKGLRARWWASWVYGMRRVSSLHLHVYGIMLFTLDRHTMKFTMLS